MKLKHFKWLYIVRIVDGPIFNSVLKFDKNNNLVTKYTKRNQKEVFKYFFNDLCGCDFNNIKDKSIQDIIDNIHLYTDIGKLAMIQDINIKKYKIKDSSEFCTYKKTYEYELREFYEDALSNEERKRYEQQYPQLQLKQYLDVKECQLQFVSKDLKSIPKDIPFYIKPQFLCDMLLKEYEKYKKEFKDIEYV